MTASSHMLGGAAMGMIALSALPASVDTVEKGVLLSGIMLGCLLCDIDNARSKISYQNRLLRGAVAIGQTFVRLISNLFPRKQEKYMRQMVGHRGLSHSLFMAALLGGLGICIARALHIPAIKIFGIGLGAGMISHILLDLFAGGVPLFAPFTMRRITLAHIKTGGAVEWLVRMLAGGVLIYNVYRRLLYG